MGKILLNPISIPNIHPKSNNFSSFTIKSHTTHKTLWWVYLLHLLPTSTTTASPFPSPRCCPSLWLLLHQLSRLRVFVLFTVIAVPAPGTGRPRMPSPCLLLCSPTSPIISISYMISPPPRRPHNRPLSSYLHNSIYYFLQTITTTTSSRTVLSLATSRDQFNK